MYANFLQISHCSLHLTEHTSDSKQTVYSCVPSLDVTDHTLSVHWDTISLDNLIL